MDADRIREARDEARQMANTLRMFREMLPGSDQPTDRYRTLATAFARLADAVVGLANGLLIDGSEARIAEMEGSR